MNMMTKWWNPMRLISVTKLQHWGCFLDRHYLTVNPACQTVGTLNVLLHSSEGLNTLTVKFFRRRVWETRHSGATGWELLSHFRGVWCSSLLQLTRSSTWQQESLFRCQMWPHWMYVINNVSCKRTVHDSSSFSSFFFFFFFFFFRARQLVPRMHLSLWLIVRPQTFRSAQVQ